MIAGAAIEPGVANSVPVDPNEAMKAAARRREARSRTYNRRLVSIPANPCWETVFLENR